MARIPVSVFKRPSSKGKPSYYIKTWDEARGRYSTARAARSVALELGLDEKKFPYTSRAGAYLIGLELLRCGKSIAVKSDPLFVDYCALIWNWETSPYIRGKLSRSQRIGLEHCKHNASYVENDIRPSFPALRLGALRPHMLEAFISGLKEREKSNRTINAIIDALRVPLAEAQRSGLIPTNPAEGLQKYGRESREKGIPTSKEIQALCAIPIRPSVWNPKKGESPDLSSSIDARIYCAILLGAVCGLRLGEIQALRPGNIEGAFLHVSSSWGKLEGLKSTKTGKVRIVPLPLIVKKALLKLSKENPHGPMGFFLFGLKEAQPMDCRAIERGFMHALSLIGIDEEKRKARNLSFHSLRHYSNAILRGAVSGAVLRKLTGHSSEAMTNHYDHMTDEDLQALAAAQVSRILPFIKASSE